MVGWGGAWLGGGVGEWLTAGMVGKVRGELYSSRRRRQMSPNTDAVSGGSSCDDDNLHFNMNMKSRCHRRWAPAGHTFVY